MSPEQKESLSFAIIPPVVQTEKMQTYTDPITGKSERYYPHFTPFVTEEGIQKSQEIKEQLKQNIATERKERLSGLVEPQATGLLPLDIYKQFEYEKKKISLTDYEDLSAIDKIKLGVSDFGMSAKGIETLIRGGEVGVESFVKLFERAELGLRTKFAPTVSGKSDIDFGKYTVRPTTGELYQKSLTEFKTLAVEKQEAYESMTTGEAMLNLGLESPVTMFIPIGYGIGAGTKIAKYGLATSSYLVKEKAAQVGLKKVGSVMGGTLDLTSHAIDPALKGYFSYVIGKEIISSESPEEAVGKIGAFTMGIPAAGFALKTGGKHVVKAGELTGLVRAKTYGYGKE
ncbi:MAG: hypothetical protein Q8M92_01935, partial [Candidatus Subteraquimicrobiales bacterium]|nr:hypothetical protein [Candidatus Subteraquimicrobiales bacterium]